MQRLLRSSDRVNPWLNTEIRLSRGRSWPNGTTGDPEPETWRVRDLLDYLTQHQIAQSKHDVRYFSPGLFGALAKRRKKLGRDAHIIAFDFDGEDKRGVPLRWLVPKLRELREIEIAYVLHTSHSHGEKADPLHFRGRVVLFADRPIADADEYRRTWQFWAEFFDEQCDPAPKAINSVFYPPTRPRNDRRFFARAFAALPFDTDTCQTDPPTAPVSYPPVDLSTVPHDGRIKAALQELAAMPPAVEGASGRHQTMLAILLGHDYGIEWRVWCEVVAQSDWNKACLPPWKLGDLLGHFRGVYDSAENAFGAKCSARSAIKNHNCRTCTADRAPSLVRKAQITLLSGAMASGKTGVAAIVSREHARAIFQAQNRALVLALAGRVGLETYDRAADAQRVATTQASLLKLPGQGWETGGFYCVDEYFHDLAFYHSGCTRDAYNTFIEVHRRLAFADRAIAMDAQMNPWLRNFMRKAILRVNPDAQIQDLHIESEQLRRTLCFLASVKACRNEFLALAREIDRADDGRKLALVTDTKAEVEEAQRAVEYSTDLRVKVIHGSKDKRALLDPDVLLQDCDVLIINHAAARGISFQVPVHKVFAIFSERDKLIGDDKCQMLARFRVVEDTTIMVGMHNFRPCRREENPRKIIERVEKKARAAGKVSELEMIEDDLFMAIWGYIQHKRAIAYNRPRTDFEWSAQAIGWKIENGTSAAPDVDMQPFKDARRQEIVDNIMGAPEIDDDEAEELKHDYELHDEDPRYWSLKQWILRDRYGWLDTEIVEADHNGRLWSRVKNLELLKLSVTHPEIVKKRDSGRRHATQVRADYHRCMLVREMIEHALGVEVGEEITIQPGESQSVGERFAEILRRRADALRTFFPKMSVSTRNLGEVFKSLLAKLRSYGAEIRTIRSNGQRWYRIGWLNPAYGQRFRERLGLRLDRAA